MCWPVTALFAKGMTNNCESSKIEQFISVEEIWLEKNVTFSSYRICKYDQLAITRNPELAHPYQYPQEKKKFCVLLDPSLHA